MKILNTYKSLKNYSEPNATLCMEEFGELAAKRPPLATSLNRFW